ncbi:MAG: ACT domain-containing protein, partial [Acidobacteriota bacterium]
MDSISAQQTAILLVDCPDQKGLVAAIADFLYRHGANILHADQHQDHELQLFFMRVEWELRDFDMDAAAFAREFEPLARRLQMRWRVEYVTEQPSVAFFVSRQLHCLS